MEVIARFMREVGVTEAILYGSRARGDHLKTSDVDLMVISPHFHGTRFVDRLPPLHRAWDPDLPPLEVLAYTPEEFERARQGLGIERVADRTGVRITLSDGPDGAAFTQLPASASGGEAMLHRTRDWLTEAETQERCAQVTAEAQLYSQAIYHARQAVELALKAAILQLRRTQPPGTHSLVELAAEVCDEPPEEVRAGLRQLDPYYILTRYPTEVVPSPSKYYEEQDASVALATMRALLDWVRERLPETPAPDGSEEPSGANEPERE